MNRIFNLQNVDCQYKGTNTPVLHVEELVINQGDIVFFVGPSGVGKSTILETLGLMSDTISHSKKSDSLCTLKTSSDTEISYYNLWNLRESQISKIRHENFSFIFQSTNLFESLSAIENVYLPTLFKVGDELNSVKRVKKVISDIFPTEYETMFKLNSKITELSGGQRQRLAFCRAVAHDFRVLFADEPTGNLDVANSHNLMEALQKNVVSNNGTAIIVSHDINLSLRFANKVVHITKEDFVDGNFKRKKIGVINNQNSYEKNINGDWVCMYDKNKVITPDQFKEILISKFN
jgi:lipoprotein-releasing system ATP-binding protein